MHITIICVIFSHCSKYFDKIMVSVLSSNQRDAHVLTSSVTKRSTMRSAMQRISRALCVRSPHPCETFPEMLRELLYCTIVGTGRHGFTPLPRSHDVLMAEGLERASGAQQCLFRE